MKIKRSIKALIILDGFGISNRKKYNAIYKAKSLILKYMNIYSSCCLKASGKAVGLFDNLIGNSQVGHITIGAGRIIKQPITLIHEAILNKKFFKNKILIKRFSEVKNGTVHLMGLLSDAGVHSHIELLFALLKLLKKFNIKKVIVHAFLDGRDVPPKSALKYLIKLEKLLKKLNIGKIGSLHGRFYAMDRDKNWDRTEKSYNLLIKEESIFKFKNYKEALEYFYKKNITDEFIEPSIISEDISIKDQDGLIFFNTREDRARQLTKAIIDKDFNKFKVKYINLLWFITGIKYSKNLNTDPICRRKIVKDTLFDVFEKNNISIFSIAETEKYAHITYFFNGLKEEKRPNETRVLIKSKSYFHDYTKMPEMSACQITDSVINSIENDPKDFYLINYANADMVGHSGDLNSTIEAIKYLDKEIKRLKNILVEKYNGTIYITSDHGKAEELYNPKSKLKITSHTTNKVPFIVVSKSKIKLKLKLKGLKDIAPFILKNLNLKIPKVMR